MRHIIHCRHCGVDNKVDLGVVGKRCYGCGNAIFSPEVERAFEVPGTHPHNSGEFFLTITPATADRTDNFLRVVCPHCRFMNELAQSEMLYVFLCHECGAPVAVE